jgi:hypothetical protein
VIERLLHITPEGVSAMTATRIMVIRHAEKPSDDGSIVGVDSSGSEDAEELVVQGWQRSGALARFFAPVSGRPRDSRLDVPDVIFASSIAPHSKSLRPQHTVLALSQILREELDLSHPKGDEANLVNDAISRNGTVLIAWEHEAIPGIANQILRNTTSSPQKWPKERFDLVWVFTPTADGTWSFEQVPQQLLPGDRPDVIPT